MESSLVIFIGEMWLLGNPYNYFNGRRQIVYLFCGFHLSFSLLSCPLLATWIINHCAERVKNFTIIGEEELVVHITVALLNAENWFKREFKRDARV